MLNRRLIRIKVFKVLYSCISSGSNSFAEAEKNMHYSCEKTLHLYYFMLNAAVALKQAADAKIETGMRKFNPTEEERNPNLKFSENKVSEYLLGNPIFKKYCEENVLSWNGDLALFVKKLFASISEKDYFKEYMERESRSMAEDCDLFIRIFEEEFEDNEALESFLEDMSIYWIDDLGYVLNTIIRNLELLRKSSKMPMPGIFMKEDDKEYAFNLLRFSLANYSKYMDIIRENIANWDPERVVTTDLVLIEEGIAEAVGFPNIPVKVTINEYVEISKYYSTHNSKIFVNGLLDRIIQKMIKSGEIVKSGRGLIEN
ncbi:MAG: transcription antitermination protein NusB [Bacteroidales bacterium]|nr:transcription antitermination protein NusB [Bacteroidales bacterium]MBO7257044.1 transcription antitermination protein NusB [Bacteroidales bacterium]MBO7284788.1 transcription antitermination protein NusB [Bacteroidales bacterium]MBO7322148.1 transcription antitermination protein NusB [Bacteroidales bacterium]MBR4974435.1 transcription antitermination protein NusB [Bacteroidales bacterium]